MNAPTPAQVRLVYEVECFTATHGRAPTYRELAIALGVSHPAVWKRAWYAGKKGLLGGLSGLDVTEAGRAAVNPLLGG